MTRYSRIFNTILFVALFTTAALGQDPPETKDPVKTEPEKLERTNPFDGNVDFPEVEGWILSKRHNYQRQELGYSVNYDSYSNGRMTVYVYNDGLEEIPNDLWGPTLDQLEKAKREIWELTNKSQYNESNEILTSTAIVGGSKGNMKALYSQFIIKRDGKELDSEIYIFPYENYFIKIRFTASYAANWEKNEEVERLFLEIDRLFFY